MAIHNIDPSQTRKINQTNNHKIKSLNQNPYALFLKTKGQQNSTLTSAISEEKKKTITHNISKLRHFHITIRNPVIPQTMNLNQTCQQ